MFSPQLVDCWGNKGNARVREWHFVSIIIGQHGIQKGRMYVKYRQPVRLSFRCAAVFPFIKPSVYCYTCFSQSDLWLLTLNLWTIPLEDGWASCFYESHFYNFTRNFSFPFPFSVHKLVAWLFNVTFKIELSWGMQQLLSQCVPLGSCDYTSDAWCLTHRDTLIYKQADTHRQATNMHLKHNQPHSVSYSCTNFWTHIDPILLWCSSMARIRLILIQHSPLHDSAIFLGLNHMFTALAGGPLGQCGTSSHNNHPKFPAMRMACAQGIVRLSQRWKDPVRLHASELHKDTTCNECQYIGSFPTLCRVSVSYVAWLLLPVRRVNTIPCKFPPSQVTHVKLVRLLQTSIPLLWDGDANERHGC